MFYNLVINCSESDFQQVTVQVTDGEGLQGKPGDSPCIEGNKPLTKLRNGVILNYRPK